MNYCPNCGHKLAAAEPAHEQQPPSPAPTSDYRPDPAMVGRFEPKLIAMMARIEEMSEEEYGEWLEALPGDEFLHFIAIGPDGVHSIWRNKGAAI